MRQIRDGNGMRGADSRRPAARGRHVLVSTHRRFPRMRWTLVTVPLFAAVAFGGQVRVVAPVSAPYLSLQDAINAAANGDIILVKTGTYSSLRVDGKSVTVVAENGASVLVSSGARTGLIQPQHTLVLS